MNTQIDLFTYQESQELTEQMLLALDTLHVRWCTLDPKYYDNPLDYQKIMKAGASEWYPLELMPEFTNTRPVIEALVKRGWIEVAVEINHWGKRGPGARITREGIEAWKRHEDECFDAYRKSMSRAKQR